MRMLRGNNPRRAAGVQKLYERRKWHDEKRLRSSGPTPTQAMWGIRQEEKTQALEKKHGVYRGEVYQVLVECPSDDPKSEKWKKKYKKMKVVGVSPHIVTLQDSKGFRESFRWHEFFQKRR